MKIVTLLTLWVCALSSFTAGAASMASQQDQLAVQGNQALEKIFTAAEAAGITELGDCSYSCNGHPSWDPIAGYYFVEVDGVKVYVRYGAPVRYSTPIYRSEGAQTDFFTQLAGIDPSTFNSGVIRQDKWPDYFIDNSLDPSLATQAENTHTGCFIAYQPVNSLSPTASFYAVTDSCPDPMEAAIETGNALLIPDRETALQSILDEIEVNRHRYLDAKVALFNLAEDGQAKPDGSSLTQITWDPTHDASTFVPTYGVNEAVLMTNDVFVSGKTVYEKAIGVIGETASSKYMILGSNPMRTWQRGFETNEQTQQFMANSISWLTGKATSDITTNGLNVVIAQMENGYYFPDESATRNWLDNRYPDTIAYNPARSCNGTELASCISTNTDLIIISQYLRSGEDAEQITEQIELAQQNGIPVLYLHHDGNQTALGKALFNAFDVSYEWDNYWKKLGLNDFDITASIGTLPVDVAKVQTLIQHFLDSSFTIDLSQCNSSCSNLDNFKAEFQEATTVVRNMTNSFDSNKVNLFEQPDLRYQKLLILLADHFRQTVVFPMNMKTTDTTTFLQSYYADHVIYNYRPLNPAQLDLGNFSRSNFSHITPSNRTVELLSKANFQSAGVYALPGQTFTVRRIDSQSAATTSIFVNSLRSGASKPFSSGGYIRPKYLQSQHINVLPGETIEFTSPYGGPVQIGFGGDHKLAVEFEFTNIGRHPHWRSESDNVFFEQAFAQGDYDWVEVATPYFEVHSTLSKMKTTLSNTNWSTPFKLSQAINAYIHDYPHVLAGFKGDGVSVIPEIHDFAAQQGWDISTLDIVKHMNADQPTCGYGCSGNPYDAGWSFNPVGHGDIHELGHGLEKGRFRFSGWEGHASTNPYSYYSKSQFFKNTGQAPSCQKLPFKSMYETLQVAQTQDDPFAYMQQASLTGWNYGVGMYVQMMMAAQNQGELTDGWHLLARLHMLEREFNQAKKNETDWLLKRDSLGFSHYNYDEIKSIANNDWLAVAISFVTRLDFADYLTMWGIEITEKAMQQISQHGYAVVPREYYKADGNDYCLGLDKPTLAINGSMRWSGIDPGNNIDVALNKPTTISSYYNESKYPASHAVDGLSSTFVHSQRGSNEWLEIDLEADYKLNAILLTNRTDCCQSRTQNSEIVLLDAARNPVWASGPLGVNDEWFIDVPSELSTRYIRFEASGEYVNFGNISAYE
ncbi:ImpA family metalloprotease [Photobacterium makurazakiensis]|uniref:ImpA family metalloprotease n=1 Tax=Photobacterium makurazakiensis TaxID=2910234 RepID=UPI003D0E02F2